MKVKLSEDKLKKLVYESTKKVIKEIRDSEFYQKDILSGGEYYPHLIKEYYGTFGVDVEKVNYDWFKTTLPENIVNELKEKDFYYMDRGEKVLSIVGYFDFDYHFHEDGFDFIVDGVSFEGDDELSPQTANYLKGIIGEEIQDWFENEYPEEVMDFLDRNTIPDDYYDDWED